MKYDQIADVISIMVQANAFVKKYTGSKDGRRIAACIHYKLISIAFYSVAFPILLNATEQPAQHGDSLTGSAKRMSGFGLSGYLPGPWQNISLYTIKYFLFMHTGITQALLMILLISACTSIAQQRSNEFDDNKPESAQARLIRGPYLQNASSQQMMIRWRTDASTRSRVRFGLLKSHLNLMVDDSSLVTEHQITLTHLQANTKYYYSIGGFADTLQGGEGNFFFSLPAPGDIGHYRIGVFGDCGNNSMNQRRTRDQFIKYLDTNYLNAWILLGDNAYNDGTDAEFQSNFFNLYKDNLLKKFPLFPCPGNHDYHDVELSAAVAQNSHTVPYYQNFSMPSEGESGGLPSHSKAFYSYDIGNVHFLSLDSYGKQDHARLYDTSGPQVVWVKNDLENNRNKQWIVVYWHHPPYTMGSHNSDTEVELVKIRENFIRILERYGVDLVLCGHSHDYERSRLMSGNYGMETTFDSLRHSISNSSGKFDGSLHSSPYLKDAAHHLGTVYVVTGSAGKLGGKQIAFPHNAMYFSDADHGGASLLEVSGNRMDFKWICADGVIRDQFTMMKNLSNKERLQLEKMPRDQANHAKNLRKIREDK